MIDSPWIEQSARTEAHLVSGSRTSWASATERSGFGGTTTATRNAATLVVTTPSIATA